MKKILLLAFLASSFCLRAQLSIEIHPDNLEYTMQTDLNDNWSEPVAHAKITNTSNQTIKLRWERVIVGTNCPDEWETRICDNIQCYNTNTSSNVVIGGQPNVPVILAPGDTTLLDVHILPRMVAGCCDINLNLFDVTNPNSPVALGTAEYKVCVSALTSVNESTKASLRVYPNPTANAISITRNPYVKQLYVSNILGKRVKTFSAYANGKYDMSDLPDGIYLVSMVDANRKVIKTVRVSKRNVRP